ncbi:hypothetical protein AM493_03525 [Flavobacterium akiainvivens]|uniref:Uncharacterized protein n=1 Tax=Flavobacterium akiainvivens TaxID=1202724 RepID=A0A0M9VHE1_9FLAO|nr:hypothetical protein [Flavobacterium akiainvivens]KOS05209.1 hypothetical protein AM493_03525 [Flavobacterium akiainvivens]SFQ50621.1 hypothetical protein SAMN05444144_10699 [Flavobacterium akiainvivens]
MSTLEIRKELHEMIDREDSSTLEGIYGLIKNYISHKEEWEMIEEAEEDIKAGRIFSTEEVKSMIESWTKKR